MQILQICLFQVGDSVLLHQWKDLCKLSWACPGRSPLIYALQTFVLDLGALQIISSKFITLYVPICRISIFLLNKTFQFSLKQLQWLNFLQTIWQTVPYHSTYISNWETSIISSFILNVYFFRGPCIVGMNGIILRKVIRKDSGNCPLK